MNLFYYYLRLAEVAWALVGCSPTGHFGQFVLLPPWRCHLPHDGRTAGSMCSYDITEYLTWKRQAVRAGQSGYPVLILPLQQRKRARARTGIN